MARVWLWNVICHRSRIVNNKSFNVSIYVCVLLIFMILYFDAGIFARLQCHKPGRSRARKFVSQRHVVASNLHECCETFQLLFGCLLWIPISCCSWLVLFDVSSTVLDGLALPTLSVAMAQCCGNRVIKNLHSWCVHVVTHQLIHLSKSSYRKFLIGFCISYFAF